MKTFAEPKQDVMNELQWKSSTKAEPEKIPVRYSGSFNQSDDNIDQAASNALIQNASVPPDRVKIRVQDGVVTLSGEINWEYQKFAAREAVRYLMGVVSINNQITIKPKIISWC